ncbi:MAG: TRAP transporter TatT component family protein [Desulfobacterales bacterium]|nr:TRAP transporter TatT component family protein [Desulfobacterales bacterium]
MKKSSEYYSKAVEVGTEYLYARFFRAKFLHAKTGDREAFRKDLEWVLAQDPHKALTPYPWSVYYQRKRKKCWIKTDSLQPNPQPSGVRNENELSEDTDTSAPWIMCPHGAELVSHYPNQRNLISP